MGNTAFSAARAEGVAAGGLPHDVVRAGQQPRSSVAREERLRCGRHGLAGWPSVTIDDIEHELHPDDGRVGGHDGDHPLADVFCQDIVRVQEDHDIASGRGESAVHRRALTVVRGEDRTDPITEGFDDRS